MCTKTYLQTSRWVCTSRKQLTKNKHIQNISDLENFFIEFLFQNRLLWGSRDFMTHIGVCSDRDRLNFKDFYVYFLDLEHKKL